MVFNKEWIQGLGSIIGVPEEALRLLIGMLIAYPIALLYINSSIRGATETIQHIYFTLTGILVAWWTINAECVLHNLVCIIVTFVSLKLFRRSKYVVVFNFIFQLGYLNIGYILNNSFGPTVTWTTPHCVLCLRLIGVACDVYDGSQDAEETTEPKTGEIRKTNQKVDTLKEVPSLLEMTSHVFYLPSYFVGPQHSMSRYRRFIKRNMENSDMTGSLEFGLNRFFLGFLYLGINAIGSLMVPVEYVTTDEFLKNDNFFKQTMYLIIWIKIIFAKYMGVWLLADGSVAITGLGFNGRDRTEWKLSWDGMINVKPALYENCGKFVDLVDCFNINTNLWCKNYVYKRCRALGFFPTTSHLITLAFLAIWHGLCSGYFLCFFFEIFPITFEKQILRLSERKSTETIEKHPWMKDVCRALGKIYFLFFLPHCLIPFVFIKSESYLPVLWSTNFLVVTAFGGWFVIYNILRICVDRAAKNPDSSGYILLKKES